MKIISFLAATALVSLMLAGCSTNDLGGPDCGGKIPSTPVSLSNSDVRIQLSSKSEGTRASIESTEQGNFNLNGLRVFCLATRQMTNGVNYPINWTLRHYNSYSVWLDNVAANATIKTDEHQNPYTDISWADGTTRYYPTGNGHAYSFYGIYPAADEILYDTTHVYALMNVDGHTDVLWGSAEDLTSPYAYSAKYFRQNPAAGNTAQMNFKHVFVRLKFALNAGQDANGSYDPAAKTAVQRIEVGGVPQSVFLCVADTLYRYWEGQVIGTMGEQAIPLRDSNDSLVTKPYYPKDDGSTTPVDGYVLVPVPNNGSYTMNITLLETNEDGTKRLTPYVIKVPINLADGYNFEPGHSYTVTLTVYSSTKISINAKLSPWVEDNTPFTPETGEAI